MDNFSSLCTPALFPKEGLESLKGFSGVAMTIPMLDGSCSCQSCETCWKMLFLSLQVTIFINGL